MSQAEPFTMLYSRVGRSSRIAGVGFITLSILLLILSVYDQFIVFEVDSVVAFLAGVLLLFRDPRARVRTGVLDAMLLSSSQAMAELTSRAHGYVYMPLGESVEDVVVVPTSSPYLGTSAGDLHASETKITPPGRALATLFLRESGLTRLTMDGLAVSLPRVVPENLGLAHSLSTDIKGDGVKVVLRGSASTCRQGSDRADSALHGVVGCTVASFFAVLYCSASRRQVVLEDCARDEATDTWSIGLNLGPVAKATG